MEDNLCKVYVAVETLKSSSSRILLQVGCVSGRSGETVHLAFSPTESMMRRSRQFLTNILRFREILQTESGEVTAKFAKEDDVLTDTLSQTDGMKKLVEFLKHVASTSSPGSSIVLVFYSIIEHQTLMMLAKNQFMEGQQGERISFLEAICRVANSTIIYEQNLQSLGGKLEPLDELVGEQEKIFSCHKLALLLQELFTKQDIKVSTNFKVVSLKDKIKRSIRVEENKYLLLSACRISTQPEACFTDPCSTAFTPRLSEEVVAGNKKLIFISIEGVSTEVLSQICQVGLTTVDDVNLVLDFNLVSSIRNTLLDRKSRSGGNKSKSYIDPIKPYFDTCGSCWEDARLNLNAFMDNIAGQDVKGSLVLVFKSSLEYRAMKALDSLLFSTCLSQHSTLTIILDQQPTGDKELTIKNKSFPDFWSNASTRALDFAKAVKDLYQRMELSIGGSFEFDETSGGTMHNSQESFRAAWVSEWRYLIPDYFGPGIPSFDPPLPGKLPPVLTPGPGVGLNVLQTLLYGVNTPLLVDLGDVDADVLVIRYEANLVDYEGRGHAGVIRGSKNFAFVLLRPRHTLVDLSETAPLVVPCPDLNNNLVTVVEPATPVISYKPLKTRSGVLPKSTVSDLSSTVTGKDLSGTVFTNNSATISSTFSTNSTGSTDTSTVSTDSSTAKMNSSTANINSSTGSSTNNTAGNSISSVSTDGSNRSNTASNATSSSTNSITANDMDLRLRLAAKEMELATNKSLPNNLVVSGSKLVGVVDTASKMLFSAPCSLLLDIRTLKMQEVTNIKVNDVFFVDCKMSYAANRLVSVMSEGSSYIRVLLQRNSQGNLLHVKANQKCVVLQRVKFNFETSIPSLLHSRPLTIPINTKSVVCYQPSPETPTQQQPQENSSTGYDDSLPLEYPPPRLKMARSSSKSNEDININNFGAVKPNSSVDSIAAHNAVGVESWPRDEDIFAPLEEIDTLELKDAAFNCEQLDREDDSTNEVDDCKEEVETKATNSAGHGCGDASFVVGEMNGETGNFLPVVQAEEDKTGGPPQPPRPEVHESALSKLRRKRKLI